MSRHFFRIVILYICFFRYKEMMSGGSKDFIVCNPMKSDMKSEDFHLQSDDKCQSISEIL